MAFDFNDPRRWDTVEVCFDRIVHVTQKAALFEMCGVNTWVPASQIIIYYDFKILQMPKWVAEDKGFTIHEQDYRRRKDGTVPDLRGGRGQLLQRGDLARTRRKDREAKTES